MKCWAQGFGACRGAITGEHWVPRGIATGPSVDVRGLAFCGTETRTIPWSTALSNMLCERHNNEVSSRLDQEAIRLKRSIGRDVREQPLQRGAFGVATGEPAIVIVFRYQHPAFRALTGDVGLAGVALGIQRVELPVETLLRAFAGVDGAAAFEHRHRGSSARTRQRPSAHSPPRTLFRPKNVQPFHRVPVMARAMADSDW